MNKEEYLAKAFKEIREKNLTVPFYIVSGEKIVDLEKYLASLEQSYLNTKTPIDKLFYEKIEKLRKFEK